MQRLQGLIMVSRTRYTTIAAAEAEAVESIAALAGDTPLKALGGVEALSGRLAGVQILNAEGQAAELRRDAERHLHRHRRGRQPLPRAWRVQLHRGV